MKAKLKIIAENEYIEREAVLAYMAEVKAACISNFEYEVSAVIAGMIGEIKDDEIPTADVVEVVRCKDCEYASYWYGNDNLKNTTYLCFLVEDEGVKTFADDFCSRGKRRE